MKFISKWGKKLFQSGEASTTFFFKVGQKLFQNEVETVIWKWVTVYFKVEQKLFQSWAITSKWDKMLFQIRAVISTWVNYFEKGNHCSSLKCVWFLPDSKAPYSPKHLRDNLAQANFDLGNIYVNFLNKHSLIDDIGTLTALQLLPWIISSVEKISIYWPSISCISRHILFCEKRWYPLM